MTILFLVLLTQVNPTNAADIIQCYVALDQPETALLVGNNLMETLIERHAAADAALLVTEMIEPLWQLSRFDELDEMLQDNATTIASDTPHWGVRCGRLLLRFRADDVAAFHAEVEQCRLPILQQLRASAADDEQVSYNKLYPLIMKLHLISEIEMADEMRRSLRRTIVGGSVEVDAAKRKLQTLFDEWDARLELLQPTTRTMEPVLCLRRILLGEIQCSLQRSSASVDQQVSGCINAYIGKSLLRSTELARNAELYQQAQLFTYSAEVYAPPSLFIEKAKLLWSKGQQAASLQTLERGIEEMQRAVGIAAATDSARPNPEFRLIIAEARYLIATYNADSMNTSSVPNARLFQVAIKALQESEKCLVRFAQFMEKVYGSLTSTEQQQQRGNEYQQEVITLYGKSLMYGCHSIHQSMPRLLSIWLDFSTRPLNTDSYRKVSANMNKIVERFSEQLPAFMFFTAFSQLVSRICHPCIEVYAVLKTILIKLIVQFPQQSLWMIMSVYKSSYVNRKRRCTEVFNDKRLASRELQHLIRDFDMLADRMIELTNVQVTEARTSVSKHNRALPRLLAHAEFSNVLMPTQRFLLPVLPPVAERDRPAATFNAFPNSLVYIQGIRDEMMVLTSLQRPKRIVFVGSDGREYPIMMKPKDDLRKDFRLMEFNAIVNKYLHQDAEARQRRLYIRTYAVLPLNEECGILEWVANMQPLRPIILCKLWRFG